MIVDMPSAITAAFGADERHIVLVLEFNEKRLSGLFNLNSDYLPAAFRKLKDCM
jgi:hypothetical protein